MGSLEELEKIKALGMALGSNDPDKWGGKAPMATCPTCGEPLIGTFRFPGKEFVCMGCRRLWGFVEPTPQVSTPELEARYAELKAQFDAEIAGLDGHEADDDDNISDER